MKPQESGTVSCHEVDVGGCQKARDLDGEAAVFDMGGQHHRRARGAAQEGRLASREHVTSKPKPAWSTRHFSAPADLVQSEVNWLDIHWPLDLLSGEEEIKYIALEHEHGRPVPLLPVFAKISSLSAVQR